MRRAAAEKGLSLVETLAALLVFSLITLGVAPLVLSSIRGSTVARSFTIGKTLAQRGIEQVRGLPYYIAAGTPAQRVDVLDMYFPFGANLGGTNYSGGAYTTVCTSSTVTPACSMVVPAGYEVRFKAEFVAPQGTTPENYVLKVPPADYAWNSSTTDRPESQLLRVTVTSSWTAGGGPRSFALTSIVGDRRAAEDKIRGVGRVDYAIQVIGTYVETAPPNLRSELRVVAGTTESRIEVRLLSQADQSVLGGTLRLTEEAVAPNPAIIKDSVDGAVTNLHAPPDSPTAAGAVDTVPNPAQSPADNDIRHEDLAIGRIAFLERNSTSGLTASTLKTTAENGLPYTEGKFKLNDLGTGLFDLWVHNQARTGADAPLLLSPNTDGTKPVIGVVPLGTAGQNTTEGTSSAVTGAVTAPDRRVETTASAVIRRVNLFPVIFGQPQTGDPVVEIRNLTASVQCKSTANLATSVADASYTAELKYLADLQPNNGLTDPTPQTVTLSALNTTDPLASLGTDPGDTNPLVYEDPLSASSAGSSLDVYLFPVNHTPATHPGHLVSHNHRGYIQQWESKTASTIFESNAGAGRTTTARLDGAINIVTRPSDPDRPETSLAISLAKLVCEAVDRR